MNRMKLVEILELVNEMTADVNGDYPFGLIRVRQLVIELIGEVTEERRRILAGHGDKSPSPMP